MLEGELALACVPRVGLAQDGVPVAGNNLARIEGIPSKLCDRLGCDRLALLLEGILMNTCGIVLLSAGHLNTSSWRHVLDLNTPLSWQLAVALEVA